MNGDGAGAFMHASAVVIGEVGILIEGASGSGKSSLAAGLLLDAALFGRFGRLVGDDRIRIDLLHGRLVARPHPAIAGLIERRGWGLVRTAHEPACVLGLAVALGEAAPPRLPDGPPTRLLHGVALPLLALRAADGAAENSRRVFGTLTLMQRCTDEPF